MAGMTNRGKSKLLEWALRNANTPTQFKLALVTSAIAPTAATNVLADLTEIAAGNGYTAGGVVVERSAVGFTTLTEDDTGNKGKIIMKDVVYTASGGSIPASGGGARYAVLMDDAGTPNVIMFFDLVSDRSVSAGQSLTIQASELDLTE